MQADSCKYEFVLDNLFFANIDGPEVQKGKVNMEQLVSSTDKLLVKFGHEYAEEGDNLIVIPEEEGEINVAWFMYEFVALAIPMKHVHAPGKCNKAMTSKLSKHMRTTPDDDMAEDTFAPEEEVELMNEEETQVDPRWDELKKILDNN